MFSLAIVQRRTSAPLEIALDTALLNNSFRSIEASAQKAVALIDARRAKAAE